MTTTDEDNEPFEKKTSNPDTHQVLVLTNDLVAAYERIQLLLKNETEQRVLAEKNRVNVENELVLTQTELANAKIKITETERELANANIKITETERELADAKIKITETQKELENIKEDFDKTKNEFNCQLEDLKRKIDGYGFKPNFNKYHILMLFPIIGGVFLLAKIKN